MLVPACRRILSALALALLVTGCGAMRFNRAWSDFAPAAETGATAEGMTGRWQGEWRSEFNGHSGGLRCLMTPAERGTDEEPVSGVPPPRRYRAWFLSTYARVFSFQHETLFQITGEQDGVLRFEGEQDLGKMAGGLYRYEGTVDGDDFRATFQAENGDHGVFEMQRAD